MLVFTVSNLLLFPITKCRLDSYSQLLFLPGFVHRAGQNSRACTCRKIIEGV